MSGTLPTQFTNAQNGALSIFADNQLRTELEKGFAAAVGKGVISGGGVTQTAAFSVEVASGTILYAEGVALTLGAAVPYSGLSASQTNYLWGTITRTARDRQVLAAVDTWALVLSHNTTGVPPSDTAIPLKTIVCDGAGITSMAEPSGKFLDERPASVGFTVGAEAGDVIQVTIQAQTLAGNNVATETPIQATLVDSNSKTADLTATAPNGGWVAGTGRLRRSYTANKDAEFVTASNGAVRIDITHSSGKTWYLVVVIGARIYISPAITFV